MLSVGSNIQAANDPLQKVSVEYLYNSLKHPQPHIESKVLQLRTIRLMDEKAYVRAKKTLPYVVCGMFNPPFRRTENFAYTDFFIVDIDHLREKQIDLQTARGKVEADSRVLLSFISPSEDGLKLLFRLKERCYDASMYKLFCKEFLRKFSKMHQLDQAVDTRTCDITRACFVSIDHNAYYNPKAESIDMNDYLPMNNPTLLFDLKSAQEKEERAETKKLTVSAPNEPETVALHQIKETLKMKKSQKTEVPKLPIYVPERLESIMESLKVFIEDQGISVYEIESIQYGKKIRCKFGSKLSEVNLFYGKRGFNVVQTPKRTVSKELNDTIAEIIQIYIAENT